MTDPHFRFRARIQDLMDEVEHWKTLAEDRGEKRDYYRELAASREKRLKTAQTAVGKARKARDAYKSQVQSTVRTNRSLQNKLTEMRRSRDHWRQIAGAGIKNRLKRVA